MNVKFVEMLREWDDKNDVELKAGDTVNFHNDLKKMVSGEIVKISKISTGEKIVIIDKNGIKFKRKLSEVYP
jgi:hypothetical protein